MKKLFLFVIALCFAHVADAQLNVEVTTTGGDLQAKLEAAAGGTDNVKNIVSLKIYGSLTGVDFIPTLSNMKSSSNFKSLDLSKVTSIENKTLPASTFYQAKWLESVTLPGNGVLTTIGNQAFYRSPLLTNMNIPDGITTIEDFALNGTGLKSITLPNSLTKLGTGVFSASKLEQITLPNQLTEIPANTFQGTMLTSITIPESVKSIGSKAFWKATNLTEVKLPAGLEWLGGVNTFEGTSITKLEIPSQTKIIDGKMEGMFASAASLTSVNIPANVTEIGTLTFASTALTHIDIPNSVISIGYGVFYDAVSLKSIKLGDKLEKIGADAFTNCTSLQSIVSANNTPPFVADGAFSNVPLTTATLYVPAAAINAYKQALGWEKFTNIKAIGSNANNQTIANFEDVTLTVGVSIDLMATASSNLPVTYSIADATVASLSGNKLTTLKEGETTITVKQAGDGIDHLPVEKTVKLIVMNLSWLEAPTILISGSSAKIVGPAEAAAKFTKFYVNDTEVELKSGVADLTDKKGELSLKATTADGSEVIKLKINKQ